MSCMLPFHHLTSSELRADLSLQVSINGASSQRTISKSWMCLVVYKIKANQKPSHTAAARPLLLRSERSRQSASPVTAHGERSTSSVQPSRSWHSAGREPRRPRSPS